MIWAEKLYDQLHPELKPMGKQEARKFVFKSIDGLNISFKYEEEFNPVIIVTGTLGSKLMVDRYYSTDGTPLTNIVSDIVHKLTNERMNEIKKEESRC